MADKKEDKYNRLKMTVEQRLMESGERDQLIHLLRNRLLECGWRDQVVESCKEIVRERGVESITVDQLINEVTPKARANVPDSVKKELLNKIKNSLSNQNYQL